MSCTIKYKTIKHLQDKNVINDKREVINLSEFDKLNKNLTKLVYDKYGIGDNIIKLFKEESKYVTRTDGSRRFLVRAIPNELLFDTLEEIIDNSSTKIINNLIELNKPNINLKFLSNNEIINSENPRELKRLNDSLKQDYKELNDLIDCLWS